MCIRIHKMNLGFLFIPNPTNKVLNQRVIDTLRYTETTFKLPFRVLYDGSYLMNFEVEPSRFIPQLNNSAIHAGYYIVLITEREPEPSDDGNITYVRTRWDSINDSFSLQFQKRHHVKKVEDIEPFVSCILSSCTNRDLVYIFNGKNFAFRLPDRRAPFYPMLVISPSIGYQVEMVVKPMCNWMSTEDLIKLWKYMERPGFLRWTPYADQATFFLIINSTNDKFDPAKTFYFTMEPQGELLYKQFLEQNPKLLYKGLHENALNFVETHINRDNIMTKAVKQKRLSMVLSDKSWDPGHKMRLAIAHILDKMTVEERGFELDIYGLCKQQNFINYKGELPSHDKSKAMNEYQYHFNIENQFIANYITEKLYDPIVCETLCFYYGAPNVSNFLPPRSYVKLPNDIDAAVNTIKDTIKNDVYNQPEVQQDLKEAKHRLDNVYTASVRLNKIITVRNTLVIIKNSKPHMQEKVERLEAQFKKYGFINVRCTPVPDGFQTIVDTAKLSFENKISTLVIEPEYITEGINMFESLVISMNDFMLNINHPDLINDAQKALSCSSFFMIPKVAEIIINNVKKSKPLLQDVKIAVF